MTCLSCGHDRHIRADGACIACGCKKLVEKWDEPAPVVEAPVARIPLEQLKAPDEDHS